MAIRNKEGVSDDRFLERLRRKRDQEWDLAGLARQDKDIADELEHTTKARDYSHQIDVYLKT